MDQFISKNKLKWVPYNKFKNVKYLNEEEFSIIYKATYKDKIKMIFKCFNSNENLNEFLKEV
jgi:hypothetical protein